MLTFIETTVLDGLPVRFGAEVGREECGARFAEVLHLYSLDPATPTKAIEARMTQADWTGLEDTARDTLA